MFIVGRLNHKRMVKSSMNDLLNDQNSKRLDSQKSENPANNRLKSKPETVQDKVLNKNFQE